MKATGKIWVFYNSESGKQTKPMSTVQAQMALLGMKASDFHCIHIWTPGWESWQKVEDFLSSGQKFFVLSHPPKPEKNAPKNVRASTKNIIEEITQTLTEQTTNGLGYTKVEEGDKHEVPTNDYGYFHRDFNGHDLDMSKVRKVKNLKIKATKKLPEENKRRATVRHDFKIEIVLMTKDRSFRTYSKNISLGGTLLDDEIPKEFLNKSFDLIIINRFEIEAKKRQLLFKAKIVGDITNPRRLMFLDTDPEMMGRLDALLKAYLTYQEQMKKQAG